MVLKLLPAIFTRPKTWLLGLHQYYSFLNILRHQTFTYPVSQEFLTSTSARLVNPRGHRVKTDQVSIGFPATSTVSELSDEAILALFTKGFFGGTIFAPEEFIMKIGHGKIFPVGYSGFKDRTPQNAIWRRSDIPKAAMMRIGDTLFGSFEVIDSRLRATSDLSPSYIDFGFGSDSASFGGCHRVSVNRNHEVSDDMTVVNGDVEVKLEHFRCNPIKNVDSWAEYITRFHRWYANLLFANGIWSIYRR